MEKVPIYNYDESLLFFQGDDLEIPFGYGASLAGVEVVMLVKEKIDDSDEDTLLSIDLTVADEAAGEGCFVFSAEQTADLLRQKHFVVRADDGEKIETQYMGTMSWVKR